MGDQVWDENMNREGVVTDVKAGVSILRPLTSWFGTWTAPGNKGLTETLSREERLKQRREGP